MNTMFHKVVSIKDKKIRAEMLRAHMIIILLSLVLAFVLLLGSSSEAVVLDGALTVVASILLAVVALLSLRIVLGLGVGHKK